MSAVYQFGLKLACKLVPKMERCVEKLVSENTQCIKYNPYLTVSFPKLIYKRIFGDGKVSMKEYLLAQSEDCLQRFKGQSKLFDLEQFDDGLKQFGGFLLIAIGTGGIIYVLQKLIRKYRA